MSELLRFNDSAHRNNDRLDLPVSLNLLDLMSSNDRSQPSDRTGAGARQPLSDTQLRELAASNTVRVRVNGAAGTGAVVNKGNGEKVILTDDHVVSRSPVGSIVKVDFQGRTYQTRVIGRDTANDVAVLALPPALSRLSGLTMAPSGRNQEGEKIITAGHPHASEQIVITQGTMGGERRASSMNITDAPKGQDNTRPLEEAQMRVKHGNSGGAVINQYGQLVGLVEAGDGDTVYDYFNRSGEFLYSDNGKHSVITPIDLAQNVLNGMSGTSAGIDGGRPAQPDRAIAMRDSGHGSARDSGISESAPIFIGRPIDIRKFFDNDDDFGIVFNGRDLFGRNDYFDRGLDGSYNNPQMQMLAPLMALRRLMDEMQKSQQLEFTDPFRGLSSKATNVQVEIRYYGPDGCKQYNFHS